MDCDFLSWRGHHVHVTAHGSGEPLLLVPGLGNSVAMWDPFIAQFANRRVIRLDAPGTGRSSTPFLPVTIPSLSDLLAAVLDTCGAPSADVVGFSYGGAVAQQFAYSHPSRVRRLVLAATFFGVGSVPGSQAAIASLSTPLRYYSTGYAERTAALTSGGATGRDQVARRRMIEARRLHPPSSYGYALQLMSMAGWSSWPFLDRIPHDTLVIAGDDDPLVPVENAQLIARRMPRARLEIVEDAGHLLLWDDAVNLGGRINRFLGGDAAPRASQPQHST
jgi:pimeloyl-ACP methyl ester carboxylesterase